MDDATAVELLKAIRDHSGLELDSIRDAGTHGADSGFGGFTYYSDTCEFYDVNHELLWKLISEDADDFGYPNVMAFVASLGGADYATDEDTFKNLIAWYALEKCGQWLLDRREARC